LADCSGQSAERRCDMIRLGAGRPTGRHIAVTAAMLAHADPSWAVAAVSSMARYQQTREEYLATSLSRLKPWEAQGISRRTYERRRRKLTVASPPVASPPVASPPVASPPVASPSVASPPVASPPAASPPAASAPRKPTRPDRVERTARNSQSGSASSLGERLRLVRLVDDILVAQGQTTLTKRTDTKTLPKPYQDMQLETLRQNYRRALKAVPADYHRRLSLLCSCGVADIENGRQRRKRHGNSLMT
jgi:hypothetical protein